jgi:hypothetical protein
MTENTEFEMICEYVLYPGSSLEGLRKSTHYVNHNSLFVNRDSKPGLPESK